MSNMSEIDITLRKYEESLNTFGHANGLVQMLKRSLLGYGVSDVNEEVYIIDCEFDMLVFNNQTEGRF